MEEVMIGAAALPLAAPLTLRAEDVDLDALRSALDKYQDLNVALADGYVRATDCVPAAMET